MNVYENTYVDRSDTFYTTKQSTELGLHTSNLYNVIYVKI